MQRYYNDTLKIGEISHMVSDALIARFRIALNISVSIVFVSQLSFI